MNRIKHINGPEEFPIYRNTERIIMTVNTGATDTGIDTAFQLDQGFVDSISPINFDRLKDALSTVAEALDFIYNTSPDTREYLTTVRDFDDDDDEDLKGYELDDTNGANI